MTLQISFAGVYYRGTESAFCKFCGKYGLPMRYEWVIHENEMGIKISLCERHYKQWVQKRDMALIEVSDQFRAALKELNDSNMGKTQSLTAMESEAKAVSP